MTIKGIICGLCLVFFGVSMTSKAAEFTPQNNKGITQVETEAPQVVIMNNSFRVQKANGKIVEVYNLTGVRVAQYRIDGEDKHFTLTMPKGIYLLKIGKDVRKISIH